MANRAFEIALALFLFLSMVSFLTTMMPTDQTVTTSEFSQENINNIGTTAEAMSDPDIGLLEWGIKLLELALRSALLIMSIMLQATLLIYPMLINFGVPVQLALMITGGIWIVYAVALYNMYQAKQGI